MGSFDIQNCYLHSGDADEETYDAEEIAGFAAVQPVTAMQVVERGGELFYGGEVNVFVAAVPRALGKCSFVRLEVKCRKGKDSPIKNGHHAVLSEHPYSLGWCHFEPFKPPRLETRSNLPELKEEDSLEDALACLAGLDCDYWETSDFRTAGFFNISKRKADERQRENNKHRLHVLGVCEDARAYHQQLMVHPRIEKLLTDTRKRTIRIAKFPEDERRPEDKRVNEEVAGGAYELMVLAVWQALAGPHKNGDRWVSENLPVHVKVDHIYRDLLNARNRLGVKKHKTTVGFTRDEFMGNEGKMNDDE
jgi:hypothetical protein